MRSWTGVAVLAAAATVAAVFAVVVPAAHWTPSLLLAVLLLLCSIVLPAVIPSPRPRSVSEDATAIWLIGPLGGLLATLLALAAGACWWALTGQERGSWVADVLWVGALVTGYSVLSASTRVIAVAAGQTTVGSGDARTNWTATVRRLSVATNEVPVRAVLDELAERVRFSANDPTGQKPPQNESIARQIAQLEPAMGQFETLSQLVRSIEALLNERESELQATRSRA